MRPGRFTTGSFGRDGSGGKGARRGSGKGSGPGSSIEEPGPLLYFNRTFHTLGEAVE